MDEISPLRAFGTTERIRKFTAKECERINGFFDDWINTYFVMGNAHVVPIITEIRKRILEIY